MTDDATRSTDLDALLARVACHDKKLISDPFATYFLPSLHRRTAIKRPPFITLGTHARTWTVDKLVLDFLQDGKGRQILNLGAGTDTRYWRMRQLADELGKEWKELCSKWVEVDFEEATATKVRTIIGKPELKNRLGVSHQLFRGGTGLISSDYAIIPGDLRKFSDVETILLALDNPILDVSIPTLLLTECVLVYLPPSTVNEILSWFTGTFSKAGGMSVGYDPFKLNDNFGQIMIKNLLSRNLVLPSASETPTLDSLSQRLISNGFYTAQSLTVKSIRDEKIPKAELARIAQIERIDEVEELNLVLEHYGITCGLTGSTWLEIKKSLDFFS